MEEQIYSKDHPDNHHHRVHHPHAANLRGMLGIYLVIVLASLFAIGLVTNAPFGNVFIAFLPSILLGLLGLALLTTDHFDIKYLLLALLALVVIFAVLIQGVAPDIDILAMVGISMLFGLLLILLLSISHKEESEYVLVEEALEDDVPTMIATIEDRCKAINFVIGRVYSVHHGANATLRKKINIDNDWYNELSQDIDEPEKNQNTLRGVIEKIRRRLYILDENENDVFTDVELSKLKELTRDSQGKSSILSVLAQNDSDPVEQFVQSAKEYCEGALERLAD